MKTTILYVDNRAEWRMRKIVFENDMSGQQVTDVSGYVRNGQTENAITKLKHAVHSFLHICRYIFK